MKQNAFFLLIVALFVCAFLCGCGHNALVFSSGKYLNLGIDPNTGKSGVQYVNGDQLTVVEKDNAKLTVELQDALDADGKKTTRISKIVYEIKDQTTGYDVDLAKVNKR